MKEGAEIHFACLYTPERCVRAYFLVSAGLEEKQ